MGNSATEKDFNQALKFVEECKIGDAEDLLKNTLPLDLDNKPIVQAIKLCEIWSEIFKGLAGLSDFDKGELLVSKWKQFMSETGEVPEEYEKIVYSFRKGIFSLALEYYSRISEEKDDELKAEILRKIGLCYKKLGSYEVALKFLTDANNVSTQQKSAIMAEMADCYAFCGETKGAKMLFREAFYMDAEKIDFYFLDSPLIKVLIKKVEEKGYSGSALHEWVAVYGIILGVFNVKRLLQAQEVVRLKQEIFSKESELKCQNCSDETLKPRLLLLYLLLIDYYNTSDVPVGSNIREIMLKIKLLDPEFHEQMYK